MLFSRDFAKKCPNEYPLTLASATLQQVFNGKILYYHVLNGVSQEELDARKLFKLSIVDAEFKQTDQVFFVMNPTFKAKDVLAKVVDGGLLPRDVPLRLVQMSGARIVKEVDPEASLENQATLGFRAEIVPPDQIGAKKEQLIRVTLTHNWSLPRESCTGTPFFFKITEGEPFATSKEKLLAIAKVDPAKTRFGYTNECAKLKDNIGLKDTDVLSELIRGQQTMLYIYVPGGVPQTIRTAGWGGSFKIYN
jgi:hypothetical protein